MSAPKLGPAVPGWERRPCRGMDPDLFMPDRGDTGPIDRAKAICAGCPALVREACLAWALAKDEPGVWGGTSHRERDRMRGRRGKGAA